MLFIVLFQIQTIISPLILATVPTIRALGSMSSSPSFRFYPRLLGL